MSRENFSGSGASYLVRLKCAYGVRQLAAAFVPPEILSPPIKAQASEASVRTPKWHGNPVYKSRPLRNRTGKKRGRGPVYHPGESSGNRTDPTGRIVTLRIFEDVLQRLGFPRSCGDENNGPGLVQDAGGHGDAGRLKLGHIVRGDPSVFVPERAGEQRSRVPVFSHSQKHEIKAGSVSRAADAPDLFLVYNRRPYVIFQLSEHSVNAVLRDREPREERLPGHAKVAVGMIRRHAALVPPEEVDTIPGDPLAIRELRQPLIDGLRSVTTCEHKCGAAFFLQGRRESRRDSLRGRPDQTLVILKNLKVLHTIHCNAPVAILRAFASSW